MTPWKKPSGEQAGDDADPEQPTVVEDKDIGLDGLYLGTASETTARAEAAMPGTESIPHVLTLVPPPVDPELVNRGGEDQDYGPDPIAEYVLVSPARGRFAVGPLNAAITPELRRYFGLPTFYVRIPNGRVTYMESSDAPSEATEIIAGWHLRDADTSTTETICSGAQGLMGWLATRPEGFAPATPDRAAVAAQLEKAQQIIAINPSDASIVAWPKEPAPRLDGKQLWRTLHALGLEWGDMDQFQWRDPTDQTDYLFWAEVDDGQFGYALPEEIAAGRQHFKSVRFTFEIPRTPHPVHVLGEMIRAAEAFANEMDCHLTAYVDGAVVDGPPELEAAVREACEKLRACGVKPGSSAVCTLR